MKSWSANRSSVVETIMYKMPKFIWSPWLKANVRRSEIQARQKLSVWSGCEKAEKYWAAE